MEKLYHGNMNQMKAEEAAFMSNKLYFRLMDTSESYPLTGSGKRSIGELANMSTDNTIKLDDGFTHEFNAKKFILRR